MTIGKVTGTFFRNEETPPAEDSTLIPMTANPLSWYFVYSRSSSGSSSLQGTHQGAQNTRYRTFPRNCCNVICAPCRSVSVNPGAGEEPCTATPSNGKRIVKTSAEITIRIISLAGEDRTGGRAPARPVRIEVTYFFAVGGVGTFVGWHSVQFCCAGIPTVAPAFHVDFGTNLPSFHALRSTTSLWATLAATRAQRSFRSALPRANPDLSIHLPTDTWQSGDSLLV